MSHSSGCVSSVGIKSIRASTGSRIGLQSTELMLSMANGREYMLRTMNSFRVINATKAKIIIVAASAFVANSINALAVNVSRYVIYEQENQHTCKQAEQ